MDIQKPADDPYDLLGDSWPSESESAYTAAETSASDASTTASTQAESARDAESKMDDEHGRTASAVSGGYSSVSTRLVEQSRNFTTVSAWMLDASAKVGKAKNNIASLVLTGTQAIQAAQASELAGHPIDPSSGTLTTQYRNDIASIATQLSVDLDGIGHSLHGDAGSSNTPSYTSVSLTPTPEHHSPAAQVAAYNHGAQPTVEPHQLPPMPRVTSAPSAEASSAPSSSSVPSALASPHAVNPTLSNLIAGNASPSGSSTPPSGTGSPASHGTPAGQGAQTHQTPERHQEPKSAGLPRIPSVALPNIPAAAATITTAVSAASGTQLPTTTSAPATPLTPASTGTTPGSSGTSPIPSGLAPIGGLATPPPVVQASPVSQGTPASPSPGVQAPAPQQTTRGPLVDAAWLQRTYGLSPGLELSKSETTSVPVRFISELSEPEAHLHRELASLRQQFDEAGWSQSLAVATIRKGFETKTVYVTADGLSIHPHGVLLPHGVIPLDEMPGAPIHPRLYGSLMVQEKLRSLIPRGWEIEQMLSTVPGGEDSQSVEQCQALVEAGEVLDCKVSRGRADVTDDEAMSVFARAAIGSAGCGELDAESSRLRAARWVGVQPIGYRDVLARWYLADAAEQMSRGDWGDAVYSAERYMSIMDTKSQAA